MSSPSTCPEAFTEEFGLGALLTVHFQFAAIACVLAVVLVKSMSQVLTLSVCTAWSQELETWLAFMVNTSYFLKNIYIHIFFS